MYTNSFFRIHRKIDRKYFKKLLEKILDIQNLKRKLMYLEELVRNSALTKMLTDEFCL